MKFLKTSDLPLSQPTTFFIAVISLAFVLVSTAAVASSESFTGAANHQLQSTTIAFGSCLSQWKPQPFWLGVERIKPHAFIFLGDNIYADVKHYLKQPDPQRIQQAYNDLANNIDFNRFQQFAKSGGVKLYATWDDHDYGLNDAGADYPFKLESKRYFQSFFPTANAVTGSDQPGIYHSQQMLVGGLQIHAADGEILQQLQVPLVH